MKELLKLRIEIKDYSLADLMYKGTSYYNFHNNYGTFETRKELKKATIENSLIGYVTNVINYAISKDVFYKSLFNNFAFNYKLSHGQVQQYENGIKKIKEYPIYINDFGTLDIFKIKAFTKEMIKNYDVKVVVIDYLQLISSTVKKGANREQEVAQITRSLKLLAKDENICIIALSQFSRDFDKQKRRPQLSDLRESGAIEQDADTVILLYNYAKVGIESNGAILIDIAKQRAGKLFETTLDFNGEFQRFTEIKNF